MELYTCIFDFVLFWTLLFLTSFVVLQTVLEHMPSSKILKSTSDFLIEKTNKTQSIILA